MQQRNIAIVKDTDGNEIVMIHDIRFRGKRQINWEDVEAYLKQYIGEFYQIAESGDLIYIGKDLPDEYANSEYTEKIRGGNAKAKANAAQGVPEMLRIATNKRYEENRKEKHLKDAAYGWYRYDTRFALPIYDEKEIVRYNVFHAVMLIRHDINGKMYLYDIINVKKGTEHPA